MIRLGPLQASRAEFFKALGHPVRIRILEILLAGDRSVQNLQEVLDLDQPTVSQQPAILRAKNIVTTAKVAPACDMPSTTRSCATFLTWRATSSTISSSGARRCCASYGASAPGADVQLLSKILEVGRPGNGPSASRKRDARPSGRRLGDDDCG
jgi:hypothetical protein